MKKAVGREPSTKISVLEILEKAKTAADLTAKAGVLGCQAEEERCLDALRRLKNMHIPRDVIVGTNIGQSLWKLHNHPKKRIQWLSTDVMDKLKRELFKKPNNGGFQVEEKTKKTMDTEKQGKQGIGMKAAPVLVDKTKKQISKKPNNGGRSAVSLESELLTPWAPSCRYI